MVRASLLLVLLVLVLVAGCRQILGLEPGELAPADAAIVDVAPPVDADSGERARLVTLAPGIGVSGAFPLWFVLDDADLAARARPDGADIYAVGADKTRLPLELQRWDATTGHLEAWIGITGTSFELRYGAPPAAPAPPARVFTTAGGFAAVWHLEDAMLSTTIADAVGATPGTATNLFTTTNHPSAKLGSGVRFLDLAQRIQFTNPILGTGPHTISSWVKLDAAPGSGFAPLVLLGSPNAGNARVLVARDSLSGAVGLGFFGTNSIVTTHSLPTGTWTLVHWVHEAGSSKLYVNGALVATYSLSSGSTTGNTGYVGYAPAQWGPGGNVQGGLAGTVDEVRLQTVARDAAWIAADYQTQASPAQAYTIGAPSPVVP